MSDNFLQQIQTTEDKAQEMVFVAQDKAQNDLSAEEKQLAKKREESIESSRIEAKNKIKAKQTEMKGVYNNEVEQERKKIIEIKNKAESKYEKSLPVAYQYLLNELI